MAKQKDSPAGALAEFDAKYQRERAELISEVIAQFKEELAEPLATLGTLPPEDRCKLVDEEPVKEFLKLIGAKTQNGKPRTGRSRISREDVLAFLATGKKSAKDLKEKFGWTNAGSSLSSYIKAGEVKSEEGEGVGSPKLYSLKK